MMKNTRIYSAAMAAMMGVGLLFTAGTPAMAGERESRGHQRNEENLYRYATYGAGGLAVYGLAKHNLTLGLLGAAGTYFADKKWKDEVRERHHREGYYGHDRHDYHDRDHRR